MGAPSTCKLHPFRPATEQCRKCSCTICGECSRQYGNICNECAGVYVNTKSGTKGMTITKDGSRKKKGSGGFGLASLRSGIAPKIAAGVLLLALVVLVALGFFGIGPFPFRSKPIRGPEAERVVRQNLYFAVAAIDAYQKRAGKLPTSLDQVGLGFDKTLAYQPAGNRYTLTRTQYGTSVTYDSNVDAKAFFGDTPSPYNGSAGETAAAGGK